MTLPKEERPRVLAVIPARGSSKRLPRKNIRSLLGKPLIAYTIEAAGNSKTITDFLVSSEDPEILSAARAYGAPTPFVRPEELAGDNVRNIETVHHAMTFMEADTGRPYDILVLLQPTSPVRDPAHIDEAVMGLWLSDLDSAASVKGPFKKRDPILKAVRNGVLEDYAPLGSGDEIEPFYIYNASIYAVKREYFIRNKKLISARQLPVLMDAYHSVDVDTEADLMVAEAYLRHLQNHSRGGLS